MAWHFIEERPWEAQAWFQTRPNSCQAQAFLAEALLCKASDDPAMRAVQTCSQAGEHGFAHGKKPAFEQA